MLVTESTPYIQLMFANNKGLGAKHAAQPRSGTKKKMEIYDANLCFYSLLTKLTCTLFDNICDPPRDFRE